MHLILKIGISRNTECDNTVGFPKLGHILSSLVKFEDNGSDRYAAKCKHCLGSEHTFKHTAEFFGKASIGPEYQRRRLFCKQKDPVH